MKDGRGARTALLGLVLCVASLHAGAVVGCNLSSSEQEREDNDEENNDGPPNVTNDGPPNQNDTSPIEEGDPRFTVCSGGGVSKGEDLRLVQCTGPGDLGGTGEVAQGDEYRLEAGVFEIVSTP